jgi:hypothetical protein
MTRSMQQKTKKRKLPEDYANEDTTTECTSETDTLEDTGSSDTGYTISTKSLHNDKLVEMITKEINYFIETKGSVNDNSMKASMSKEDTMYFDSLADDEKQKLSVSFETVMNATPGGNIPTMFKILNSNLSPTIKNIALKKHIMIQKIDKSSGEYSKCVNWIEQLCKIPFGKHIPIPVTNLSDKNDIISFIS